MIKIELDKSTFIGNPHIRTINTVEGCENKSSDLTSFILKFEIILFLFVLSAL